MTKKDLPDRIVWSAPFQAAFDYLKAALTLNPVLAEPDFEIPFILHTDASNMGIRAVLSQETEEGEKAVAYFSKQLLPRQQQYTAVEKECLAVMEGILHFRVYLTRVITDHTCLQFLCSISERNGRLQRWPLILQEYNFDVKYRAGCKNGNANGQSCQS